MLFNAFSVAVHGLITHTDILQEFICSMAFGCFWNVPPLLGRPQPRPAPSPDARAPANQARAAEPPALSWDAPPNAALGRKEFWVETWFPRLEAIAMRLEAIAVRLEAIGIRLEDIAIRLEAIAGVEIWFPTYPPIITHLPTHQSKDAL